MKFTRYSSELIGVLLFMGCKLPTVVMKELSENELISRLGNEQLLELVFRQQKMIQQKDRALKRLLAQFTGNSHLAKSWLNSEIMFNELSKDPKMLRAEINVLLERQNASLVEKDNQIAANNRTMKSLGMLCCTPLYVTKHIELIQKKYNLNQESQDRHKDCDCETKPRNWLEFISHSSKPFAVSIRKDLAKNYNASITSPKELCEAISSLYSRARSCLYEFVAEFRKIFIEDEELSTSDEIILQVENYHVEAFNILLKVMGLPNVTMTVKGQLLVSACNRMYPEK